MMLSKRKPASARRSSRRKRRPVPPLSIDLATISGPWGTLLRCNVLDALCSASSKEDVSAVAEAISQERPASRSAEQLLYILLRTHQITRDVDSLAQKMAACSELPRESFSCTTEARRGPLRILSDFLSNFAAAAVRNDVATLETVLASIIHYSGSSVRPVRSLAVRAATALLRGMCALLVAPDAAEWLRGKISQIKNEVVMKRKDDVSSDVRKSIAETVLGIIEDSDAFPREEAAQVLQQVFDRGLSVGMLYDHNRRVRTLGLKIAAEVLRLVRSPNSPLPSPYTQPSVSRVIQLAYKDRSHATAAQAVKTLGEMFLGGLLEDETALRYACGLVLRPIVAAEAAEFVVGTVGKGKILGVRYPAGCSKSRSAESVLELAHILQAVIAPVPEPIQKHCMVRAVSALESATGSIFDLETMCGLLVDIQASDVPLLDTLALMLRAAVKNLQSDSGLRNPQRNVASQRLYSVLAGNMGQILHMHAASARVAHLIKVSAALIKVAVPGTLTREISSIVQIIWGIFMATSIPQVSAAACRVLNKFANTSPDLEAMISEFHLSFLSKFEVQHNPPEKLPLICCFCGERCIGYVQKNLLENFAMLVLDPKQGIVQANSVLLALFNLSANAFVSISRHGDAKECQYPPEAFPALLGDLVPLFLAATKKHDLDSRGSRAFILLAKLVAMVGNEVVRTRSSRLFYSLDVYVLDSMTQYALRYCLHRGEHDPEFHAVGTAIHVLLLSCEAVFGSRMLILYLGVFASSRESDDGRGFIRRLQGRLSVPMFYAYMRSATVYASRFRFPHAASSSGVERAGNLVRILAEGLRTEESDRKCFERFLEELIMAGMKSAESLTLLSAVTIGAKRDTLSEDQLRSLFQRFEICRRQLLGLDPSTVSDTRVSEFRQGLAAQISAARRSESRRKRPSAAPTVLSRIPNIGIGDEGLTEIEERVGDEGTVTQPPGRADPAPEKRRKPSRENATGQAIRIEE